MIIYGVDTDSKVTPSAVRDAIVECFYQAHCSDSELGDTESSQEATKEYTRKIVEKAFTDSDGNFESPTKESILAAMVSLQQFAKNFRDQSIIQKHTVEIMKLVNLL